MRKARPIHLGKKGYKTLWPRMSDEERRMRNGDKKTAPGYTSSGVKMPTREEMLQYHAEKAERSKEYQKRHQGEERRSNGKFVITQNNFRGK